jgi:hypothetical protein
MTKTLRTVVSIILGCALVYTAWLVWVFYYGVEAERTKFSPVAWKQKGNMYSQNNDPGCVRGGMALDIVAEKLLQGKSKDEVKLLLGEPNNEKASVIYYELGQCSGLGWHNTALRVNFGNKQLVSNATILRY